jgi:hypothetical protein
MQRNLLFVAAVAGFSCAAKLPALSLGGRVPEGAHKTGVGIMVSPSQLQEGWAWSFDGVDYSLGVDDRGAVQYVSTYSTKVMTKEGVHVGQSFSDVKRVEGMRLVAWPGWGYVVELPSGWNAAFSLGPSMTDREPWPRISSPCSFAVPSGPAPKSGRF